MPKKASGLKKRPPAKRRVPRKAKADSAGLEAKACLEDARDKEGMAALIDRIAAEGGALVGAYRDPLGGHPLALAVLPIGTIEPPPFQRDLSETHHKRLAEVI